MTTFPLSRLVIAVAAGAALLGNLSGCVPLAIGGAAVGTSMVVTDRRTTGVQVEDQSIELKAAARIRAIANDKMYVSVTSYNRQVLLTGSVGSEADRQRAEDEVRRVEQVRTVVNALTVGEPASFKTRSNDTLITSMVKTSLVNREDIFAKIFKIVTERNTVYMMGLATRAETDRATQIVRGVSGVEKVVRLVEIVDESNAAGSGTPGGTGASASSSSNVPLPPMDPLPPAGGGAVTSPVR